MPVNAIFFHIKDGSPLALMGYDTDMRINK